MLQYIALGVIMLAVGLLAVGLWISFRIVKQMNHELKAIRDRFAESGVTFADRTSTDVKIPDRWTDLDGIPDENIDLARFVAAGTTGVLRSKVDQWSDGA